MLETALGIGVICLRLFLIKMKYMLQLTINGDLYERFGIRF